MTKALVEGGGSGGKAPSEAETRLAFGRSMKAANLPAFCIWRCNKSQLSAVCMIQDHFPWVFKNNIFPDISLTFPDDKNSPTFSSFPWPVGTLLADTEYWISTTQSVVHRISLTSLESTVATLSNKQLYTDCLFSVSILPGKDMDISQFNRTSVEVPYLSLIHIWRCRRRG